MVNNERYRAAGPPDGGDHTDKDKDEEDIFYRAGIPRPDIVSTCTGVCPCRRA